MCLLTQIWNCSDTRSIRSCRYSFQCECNADEEMDSNLFLLLITTLKKEKEKNLFFLSKDMQVCYQFLEMKEKNVRFRRKSIRIVS